MIPSTRDSPICATPGSCDYLPMKTVYSSQFSVDVTWRQCEIRSLWLLKDSTCCCDLLLSQFFDVNRHRAVVGKNLLDGCVVGPSTPLKTNLHTHTHTNNVEKHTPRNWVYLRTLNISHTPDSGLRQWTASQQRCNNPSSVELNDKKNKKLTKSEFYNYN